MLILLFLLQTGDIDHQLHEIPTVRYGEKRYTLQSALETIPEIGFRIDEKIASDEVTLPMGEMDVFGAIHEICRIHGGARILFSTYSPKIQISPGKIAAPPTSNSGPFHFLLSKILISKTHAFDNAPEHRIFLTLWMAWTNELPPAYMENEPTLTRVEDNEGNNLLLRKKKEAPLLRILGKPVIATPSTIRLKPPSPASRFIKILEGYRKTTFISKLEPIEVKLSDDFPCKSPGGRLSVTKLARGKGGLTAVIEGSTPKGPIPFAEHLRSLRFIDGEGNHYPTRITSGARGTATSKIEVVCTQIPTHARVVSARAEYVTGWETRKIPFFFKNIPLP